jgi:hypothetical protein
MRIHDTGCIVHVFWGSGVNMGSDLFGDICDKGNLEVRPGEVYRVSASGIDKPTSLEHRLQTEGPQGQASVKFREGLSLTLLWTSVSRGFMYDRLSC